MIHPKQNNVAGFDLAKPIIGVGQFSTELSSDLRAASETSQRVERSRRRIERLRGMST